MSLICLPETLARHLLLSLDFARRSCQDERAAAAVQAEMDELRAALDHPTATGVTLVWAGEFASFDEWVQMATHRLTRPGAVCVDTRGRRCFKGEDFMRARDEGAFPVRYGWDTAQAPLPTTSASPGFVTPDPLLRYGGPHVLTTDPAPPLPPTPPELEEARAYWTAGFVRGAMWWEHDREGATMWQSDQQRAAEAATDLWGKQHQGRMPASYAPIFEARVRGAEGGDP